MEKQPAGVISALWTPVDEQGELDERSLGSILEFVLEQKVHGIMALGSTGEFPRLTNGQRKTVFERISRTAAGKVLIANASHVRLRQAIELGLHARDHGADLVALLPPWFYPMEQDDLVEFFVRAGEAIQLPLALYNFPEMTGKKISLETIRAVAKRVPVGAVKQSGADFAYHEPLGQLSRELGFSLVTGADGRFVEACALGARGMVSGLSNAVPEVLVRIYSAIQTGALDAVVREREFMNQLSARMETVPFPLNVQAAIRARGLGTGPSKVPLSSATAARYEALVVELRDLYGQFRVF